MEGSDWSKLLTPFSADYEAAILRPSSDQASFMPILQRKNNVRIGIAGWSYLDWKRIVYPARRGLNKLKYLEFLHFWTEGPVDVPPPLEKAYPPLRDISSNRSYAADGDDESLVLFPED